MIFSFSKKNWQPGLPLSIQSQIDNYNLTYIVQKVEAYNNKMRQAEL